MSGYHIEPRDGAHFVRLFADAQFFSREFHSTTPPTYMKLTIYSTAPNSPTLLLHNLRPHRRPRIPNPARPLQQPRRLAQLLLPRLRHLLLHPHRRLPRSKPTHTPPSPLHPPSSRPRTVRSRLRRSLTRPEGLSSIHQERRTPRRVDPRRALLPSQGPRTETHRAPRLV